MDCQRVLHTGHARRQRHVDDLARRIRGCVLLRPPTQFVRVVADDDASAHGALIRDDDRDFDAIGEQDEHIVPVSRAIHDHRVELGDGREQREEVVVRFLRLLARLRQNEEVACLTGRDVVPTHAGEVHDLRRRPLVLRGTPPADLIHGTHRRTSYVIAACPFFEELPIGIGRQFLAERGAI